MEFDISLFVIACKFVIFFIYSAIFIISAIFTFSIDTYNRLDEFFKTELLSKKHMNPLDINIDFIDEWLNAHNRIVGLAMLLLSAFNLVILLKNIDVLL
ncbi:MAG: hypothetical protein KKE91_02010 [Candidatus Omnitrophica bacterium]|nr:hypothetical protein [Candidatus Omnitrophota bacterium]